MKHDRATEEIRELAALYALGSLTQSEARSFEIHTQEGCSVCEAELRRFERAVAGMGLAVEEAETPDYIRDLLLARIQREPRIAAVQPERKSEPPQEKVSPAAVRPVLFQSRQEEPRGHIFAWILVVLFAAASVFAIYAWKSEQKTSNELKAGLSATRSDLDNLQILLDSRQERADDFDQIMALAGKPGVRIARVAGQNTEPPASGAILCDPEKNQCLLFGYLPPAPEGRIYQIWFVTQVAKVPAAAVIKPKPTGSIYVKVPSPISVADAAAIFISLEPDNGSKIPTTPLCAIARFY